jgi:hypothetical protein
MSTFTRRNGALLASLVVSIWILGCSGSAEPETNKKKPAQWANKVDDSDDEATSVVSSKTSASKEESATESFAPVKLGGGNAPSNKSDSKKKVPNEKQVDSVMAALKPVRVLVGAWHGVTQSGREYEELNWVWDRLSDTSQPALVMSTDKNKHYKSVRLTYLVDEEQFQLTIEDKDGRRRELKGTFSQEPEDVIEDNKPQRTYKLQVTEADDAKDRWQVVVNQQENNRYLLELSKARGSTFARFDTVSSQREGTSFALNDSDFKEKTCIISQGLGTIQVSHKGKSYWVCCTGCKAAFEEDPDKWIAKFEATQTK